MNLSHHLLETVTPDQSSPSDRRLQGPWLVLARIVCGAGALLALSLFTTSLLMRFAHLDSLSSFDVLGGWNTASLRTALAQLGLSVGFYQVYRIVLDLIFALCFLLVAAVLLWHKSNEWMALFVALVLITFGAIWPTNIDELSALYPAWAVFFTAVDQLSFTFLLAFFFFFPDGRFVPRWMRWIVVPLFASGVLSFIVPTWPGVLNILFFLSFLALALFAQISRYRRHASLLQRQQIKWVVFGFSATLGAIVGQVELGVIFPSLGQHGPTGVLYELVGAALGTLLFLPISLCVGIAMLQYRLWDIDMLIKRTLVYGLLTACIVGFYVLVVGSLGTLFHAAGNLLI
jgi:hypothetical protein